MTRGLEAGSRSVGVRRIVDIRVVPGHPLDTMRLGIAESLRDHGAFVDARVARARSGLEGRKRGGDRDDDGNGSMGAHEPAG